MNLKVYIQELYAIFTVIYISKLIANNVICCKCKLLNISLPGIPDDICSLKMNISI